MKSTPMSQFLSSYPTVVNEEHLNVAISHKFWLVGCLGFMAYQRL